MAAREGTAYCTLLMSDNYLPGAMVLAHSLRDNGTKAKLVALFTPESLRASTISELQSIYDEIIPVHPLTNATPANLWLMERPDLISTFTKIELWRQTQFKRIVYIDCDVVAVRAPDELLSLEADFAAAPDVGWPDCFNSGVMVLRPNMQDYYSLIALAERGISFDGADQGLFNMHFKNWHRLSFTYNCTPSANYQYIPAYKHFQSTISLLHFIGPQKPWNLPRQVLPRDSPYNQLLGRWWATYDRHYRPKSSSYKPTRTQISSSVSQHRGVPDTAVQLDMPSAPSQPVHVPQMYQTSPAPDRTYAPEKHHLAGDFHFQERSEAPQPVSVYTPQVVQDTPQEHHVQEQVQDQVFSVVPQYVRGEEHVSAYVHPPTSMSQQSPWQPEVKVHAPQVQPYHEEPYHEEPRHDHHSQPAPILASIPVSYQPPNAPSPTPPKERPFSPPKAEWDASREPPPVNSKPEAMTLQRQTYTMSQDTQLFQPPPSYPEAPKDMWYDVPATKPEPHRVSHIFPWEDKALPPTRVFLDEVSEAGEPQSALRPRSPSLVTDASGPTAESPLTPSMPQAPLDPWNTYARSNAWDEVPEIGRYIESIQQSRKAKTQVISGTGTSGNDTSSSGGVQGVHDRRASLKITDFPTEVERPSLPVTPAPVRRSAFWGQDEESSAELPAAEGVPRQEEWNPLARLEELRRRQSELLESPDSLLERISRFRQTHSS